MSKILHLARREKFIKPFFDFVKDHLNIKDHFFLLVGGSHNQNFNLEDSNNSKTVNTNQDFLKYFIEFNFKIYRANKIIIHGLFQPWLIMYLFFQPWLLKKSYWVMWGGDFYFPEKHSFFKKQVIKKMGHFIFFIKGDYELVQKWYGAKGKKHESFIYPSNLYKDYKIGDKSSRTINIQIGNSADPTNNHIDILKKLEKYKNNNIKIFVPLSYGNEKYSKKVIVKGKELFGDKFKPMVDFMTFDKYLEFLGDIDIAIFAHKRQQAMGNIITLLGLGKKVYMREDITPWSFFKDINVQLYNIENIKLNLINENIQKNNKKNIQKYFSKENYIKQLKDIFK